MLLHWEECPECACYGWLAMAECVCMGGRGKEVHLDVTPAVRVREHCSEVRELLQLRVTVAV